MPQAGGRTGVEAFSWGKSNFRVKRHWRYTALATTRVIARKPATRRGVGFRSNLRQVGTDGWDAPSITKRIGRMHFADLWYSPENPASTIGSQSTCQRRSSVPVLGYFQIAGRGVRPSDTSGKHTSSRAIRSSPSIVPEVESSRQD